MNSGATYKTLKNTNKDLVEKLSQNRIRPNFDNIDDNLIISRREINPETSVLLTGPHFTLTALWPSSRTRNRP